MSILYRFLKALNQQSPSQEFTLWFDFIGFCWGWLLPNPLLCLLSLFPFSLFPFVNRGITVFHSMTQNLKQALGLGFFFPPSTPFYNCLLVQIHLKLCLVSLHIFHSPVHYQGDSCLSLLSSCKLHGIWFSSSTLLPEVHIFPFLWLSTTAIAKSRSTTRWDPSPQGWE